MEDYIKKVKEEFKTEFDTGVDMAGCYISGENEGGPVDLKAIEIVGKLGEESEVINNER